MELNGRRYPKRAFTRTRKTGAAALKRAMLALALAVVLAEPARAETTIGLQALVVSGTHEEQSRSLPLTGAAALLELRQRWRPLDIVVEGIPSVGEHRFIATTNGFPRPLTNLSLFTAVSHVRLGPTGRYWAGGGIVVINQESSLFTTLRAASRVTGSRYEAIAYLPVGRKGTLELRASFMPSMHGSLSYDLPFPPAPGTDSEVAQSTDLGVEYVRRFRDFGLGGGVRSIDYVAHFVRPRALADRNLAFGVLVEARFTIFD